MIQKTQKTKRVLSILLAISLSVSMVAVTQIVSSDVFAAESEATLMSKYDSIDINSITGEDANPPEITSDASANAVEKPWYEYVLYSTQPVASFRLNDEWRLIFYDPYEYSNALWMTVTGQDSDWSSANSITVSYSTSNSITDGYSSGSTTSTSIQVQEGRDENFSHSQGISASVTKGWSNSISSTSAQKLATKEAASFSLGSSTTVGTTIGTENGVAAKLGTPVNSVEATTKLTTSTSVSSTVNTSTSISAEISAETSSSYTAGTSTNESSVASANESTTEGWSTIANRVTESTGYSRSVNKSWSTAESVTVTRTFNAGYFNSSGAPLQWKIVKYSVFMPMKYEIQCKIDGEWVSTDVAYCLLETIQGTCRAYLQNKIVYIEDWGTGEPILWDNFWKGFLTEDQLKDAYTNKLYPSSVGGEAQ